LNPTYKSNRHRRDPYHLDLPILMAEEVDYEGLQNASLGVNMMAGALAGISEHVVMYPVDSIKVSL
jgi:hypothetical protein